MTLDREILRHTVATVAYRGGKAVRGATPEFADFKAGPATRTPVEILAHIGDLYDWALSIAKGARTWNNSIPLPWDLEVSRFHATLSAFDAYLASDAVLAAPVTKLFQGPVADSLTHAGQLTLLRGIAGQPVRGESYFMSAIEAGRAGPDQASPKVEF